MSGFIDNSTAAYYSCKDYFPPCVFIYNTGYTAVIVMFVLKFNKADIMIVAYVVYMLMYMVHNSTQVLFGETLILIWLQSVAYQHHLDWWGKIKQNHVHIFTALLRSLCTWQHNWNVGIILCMRPANERRCYIVTSSLVGWAHAQNDPWKWKITLHHHTSKALCVDLKTLLYLTAGTA